MKDHLKITKTVISRLSHHNACQIFIKIEKILSVAKHFQFLSTFEEFPPYVRENPFLGHEQLVLVKIQLVTDSVSDASVSDVFSY